MAEGVASVVGGVAVACVRAAAAVAGAVGYAAPLLRRLATRLQEAVSRRLPPPPLPGTDLGGSRCAGAKILIRIIFLIPEDTYNNTFFLFSSQVKSSSYSPHKYKIAPL